MISIEWYCPEGGCLDRVIDGPYFDPDLTALVQVYKSSVETYWSFAIPEYYSDDNTDEASLVVDLSEVEDFMAYDGDEGMLWIQDVSSEKVKSGEYTV